MARVLTVGIVGAGIAGLACARELAGKGCDVTVFDKARGPGGRTATRRPEPNLQFDHGAQFFTVADPRFQTLTDDWLARAVVAEWTGRIVHLRNTTVIDAQPQHRYVGTPGMTAMAVDLADGLRIRTGMTVVSVTPSSAGWTIVTEARETIGPFDRLVVTLPAPQSAALLASHHFGVIAATVRMTACWTVMLAFETLVDVPWDGAFIQDNPLAWAARNSSKPSRERVMDCWVLQASPEWSATHLDVASEIVARDLLEAFQSVCGGHLPPHRHVAAHRWRYGQCSETDSRLMLFDPEIGLAMTGDWLADGRIEGAFLAGIRAADAICDQSRLQGGDQ